MTGSSQNQRKPENGSGRPAIRSQRTRAGFTLTEAVIGIVLLALVMAGSYRMLVMSARQIYQARSHYIAANLCKSRIERARNYDYDDLHLLSEMNIVVDGDGAPYSQGTFRRTTTVATNYLPGLTRIEVETEVCDVRTMRFTGESESISCLFTEYLTP